MIKPFFDFINLKLIIFSNNRYLLIFSFFSLLITSLYLFPHNIIYIFLYIYGFLFSWFILDSFKLSNNKGLKDLQIFFFTILVLYLFIKVFNNFINTIYCEPTDIPNSTSGNNPTPTGNNSTPSGKVKGWFDPSLTVNVEGSVMETVKGTIKEVGNQISQSLDKASDKLGTALTTVGVGGASAHVLKGTSLPPLVKLGHVLASSTGGAAIQTIATGIGKDILSSSDAHPPSPTESVFGEISRSSVGEFFNLNILFSFDPNNHALSAIFSLLTLTILNIFFIYIISISLIYIYIYNNNFELKFIDKIFPEKYSIKIKSLLIKISKKWNKTNHLIIIWSLLMLLIFNIASSYYLYLIYQNFDKFVDIFLKYKNLN
jgi:hypothetical protein